MKQFRRRDVLVCVVWGQFFSTFSIAQSTTAVDGRDQQFGEAYSTNGKGRMARRTVLEGSPGKKGMLVY